MINPRPRVSVIIPTHNRPGLLGEAIESVARQTFADWEAVIADDGSEPPVSFDALAQQFGARVRGVRHEVSRGSSAAKNSAVAASRGEVLAFLDDDDLYDPTYLARALDVLDRFPDVQVVCMGMDWFGPSASGFAAEAADALGRVLAKAGGHELEPELLLFDQPRLTAALLDGVPLAFQQQVVRRPAFERIGEFRIDALDRSFWAIRAAIQVPVALSTAGLYRYRCEGQSYFSRGDRFLDQVRADVEAKEILFKSAASKQSAHVALFRDASAKSWYHLAYHHCVRGEVHSAFPAWLKSQQRRLNFRRAKLLARMALVWARLRLAKASA